MKKSNVFDKEKIEQENVFIVSIPQDFLTRREASNYLKISQSKFDAINDLDFIRYGKSKRYSLVALKNYAEKHTVRMN